jgi:multidrug efflux system membrane fusion protein
MNQPLPDQSVRKKGSFIRRRKVAVISAASALAAGVFAFAHASAEPSRSSSSPAAPVAPKVTVATVEEKTLVEYADLIGRVDSTETVEIRPRVSGQIDSVRFQSGQLVKAGDVLFALDARPFQARVNAAAAAVEQARVHAANAEREARRADELLAAHAISSEEAESRRSLQAEARAALDAADAALTTARLELEYTEVKAPISGRVSRAFVTAGNIVSGAPGSATLLTSVVSVGDAYAYADVDEATVLKFNRLSREGRLGDANGRIPVELALSDETGYPHRGYLESVDNHLDTGTGSLILRAVFPNPDGALIPGLFARVRIPVSAPQPTLLISERSVGTDQSQKFVFAVTSDQKVDYRAVKLGPTIEGKRVVRDGLRPGEQIIVNGLQRVRPGMTVSAENAVAVQPASAARPAGALVVAQ